MTFKEWLDEIEVYSTRRERLESTFPKEYHEVLVKWLQAAYLVGYEQGLQDDLYEGN